MLLLLACTVSGTRERVEPSFLQVAMVSTDVGSAEAPKEFDADVEGFEMSLQTLDVHQEPYAFTGSLTVSVRPAQIDDPTRIDVVDGAWSGTVNFHSGYGPTRVWFTDDVPTDERPTPGYATGVSDPIWFKNPTIAQFQASDDHETNQLDHEFANVWVSDRQVVVTAVDTSGFYVTDLSDAVGSYNSLYVYTFNKPDDTIVVGAHLTSLTGIDQEYLASTQLSYPTYTVGTDTLTPYASIALDDTTACDDAAMEKLEASKVVANAVTIPDTFTEDSTDYQDYLDYGQWPMQLGSCTIYAESTTSAPDFHPAEYTGQTFSSVTGMLKEVYGKWILTILSADDIVLSAGPPAPTRKVSSR